MKSVRVSPLVTALAAGAGDGIINPAGGSHTIPYGHLGYGAALAMAGWFGTQGTRGEAVPGRWDPNIAYALMTSGVTLLASRLPRALSGGGLHAYGDEVDEEAYLSGGSVRRGPSHHPADPYLTSNARRDVQHSGLILPSDERDPHNTNSAYLTSNARRDVQHSGLILPSDERDPHTNNGYSARIAAGRGASGGGGGGGEGYRQAPGRVA